MKAILSGRALLCAALSLIGISALAVPALAARPANGNPVVDISGLLKPGLYKTTSITTTQGKSGKPETSTDCVTAESLRDFFSDTGDQTRIESYKLDGKHLQTHGKWVVGGKTVATVMEDITFENSTRMHGVVTMHVLGKHPAMTTIKLASHRIGSVADCKKANEGD